MIDKTKPRLIDINISDSLYECEESRRHKVSASNKRSKENVSPDREPSIVFKLENRERIMVPEFKVNSSPYSSSPDRCSMFEFSFEQSGKMQKKCKEEHIEAEYDRMLQELQRGVEVPVPFFFNGNANPSVSKLICFTITPKNEKSISFSPTSLTCEPSFICQGCDRTFKNSAALGGHLSRCPHKGHHRILNMLMNKCLPKKKTYCLRAAKNKQKDRK